MSDSLRDQLLQAGFAKPKAEPEAGKKKPARRSGQSRRPQTSQAATGASVQTGPKAGYTHVPSTPPKKKKSKKAPAVKPRAGSWGTRDHSSVENKARVTDPVAAEKRRQMKADIQKLIDTGAVKNFTGDEVYRFTLQNKIRELPVTENVRKMLADGELAITRLNGITRIIPAATAVKIRDINPQWVIFLTSDKDNSSDDDDEFPIPDDLIW